MNIKETHFVVPFYLNKMQKESTSWTTKQVLYNVLHNLTLPSFPCLPLLSAAIIPQMGLISPSPSMSNKSQNPI